jgi:hypothetical protein
MTSSSATIELHNDTMAAQDPFMTLVDAATALIDENGKKHGAKKKSLSIFGPLKNTDDSATKRFHHDGHSSTTPPPHVTTDKRVALVSPSTPKASNRTPSVGFREQKQSFARLLMDVLMDEKLNDVITFLPDGDAFAILEPKKFADEVMPKAFGIRTFSPFVRKLHRWGFERIMDKKTHAVDVFRHPLFIRGNYVLCDKIRCIGRLVKGPVEEALLTQAGINNKTIGMPTHQELEIRSFCERMHNMDGSRRNMEVQNEVAAQTYLLGQAARQAAVRRQQQQQQQEAQESLFQEAQLRQQAAREAEARQFLEQQVAAEAPTISQLILASLQNRSREEEFIAQELQRLKNEELLRQQLQSEANLTNNLQQARLQEFLAAQGGGMGNMSLQQQANDDIPVSALLRAALENQSGGSLAAQLRQFM